MLCVKKVLRLLIGYLDIKPGAGRSWVQILRVKLNKTYFAPIIMNLKNKGYLTAR